MLPVEGGDELVIAVHGGFVEVCNDRVSILSDVAELAGDIDVARAQAALERLQATTPDRGRGRGGGAALRRAEARLDAAQRHAS